jgi:hypothetical protein
MQRYTVYLYLETVLHVSGLTSTHHQEHIQLYLQHLAFVTPLILSAAKQFQIIQDTSRKQLGWILPDTVNTVKCSWWWAKTSPETCRSDLE